jgi:hypothetical protein
MVGFVALRRTADASCATSLACAADGRANRRSATIPTPKREQAPRTPNASRRSGALAWRGAFGVRPACRRFRPKAVHGPDARPKLQVEASHEPRIGQGTFG